MKNLRTVLIIVGVISILAGIISKVVQGGLLAAGISPLAGLTFGNSCLLLVLVLNNVKK